MTWVWCFRTIIPFKLGRWHVFRNAPDWFVDYVVRIDMVGGWGKNDIEHQREMVNYQQSARNELALRERKRHVNPQSL